MDNFINALHYFIPAGSSRRIAWADQIGGYIDIYSSEFGKGAGYVHGNYCRLKDLTIPDKEGLPTFKQRSLSVIPGEISIQVDEHQVEGALLLGSSAFWMSFSSTCVILLPKTGSAWKEKRETVQGKTVYLVYREAEKGPSKKKMGYRDEIEPSSEALALASEYPLTIQEIHSHVAIPEDYGLYLIIGPAGGGQASGSPTSNVPASAPPASGGPADTTPASAHHPQSTPSTAPPGCTEVYMAWAEDSAGACAKAEELVCQNGRSLHQSKIEQFFHGFSFRSGDKRFDQALAWAAFSGWTLVTREYGLGIWAGLPWFRDNWGRDTFIALPGILLATGQFDAAREVLATFAERQDQDPASPNYGRIPNRWRNPEDVIFNTVDGTPWFIREVWEYVQYTGDHAFALSIKPFVDRALEADLTRCDQYGFLTHGPADTWMDARIRGKAPWSERSDRAVEVQALFYTALRCGERIARLANDLTRSENYRTHAEKLRRAFVTHFWYPEHRRLADRLLDPADPEARSPVEPDLRSRPNALLAITVPSILPEEEALLPRDIQAFVLADVYKELVYPYGVASLSQQDPYFHPHHDGHPLYHKDAAYHNGTIWGWNAGFTIQALLMFGQNAAAWRLQQELARQIMDDAAVGTLSENLHALLDADGLPRHSGTFAQAWSVSEFVRTGLQGWLGIQFRLAEGCILCSPRLPPVQTPQGVQNGHKDHAEQTPVAPWGFSGTLSFGQGSRLQVRLSRTGAHFSLSLLWDQRGEKDPAELTVLFGPSATAGTADSLSSAGLNAKLISHQEIVLTLPDSLASASDLPPLPSLQDRLHSNMGFHGQRSPGRALQEASPELPPFNGPSREKNYLEQQILHGFYNKGPIESLRTWYDSKAFARQFHTDEELGASCTPYYTDFKIWAPTAAEVELFLWKSGTPVAHDYTADATGETMASGPGDKVSQWDLQEEPLAVHRMYRQNHGVWHVRLHGDFHGVYYTYRLRIHGLDRETIDPYAKSAGLNGKRGMILDSRRLEPEGWNTWHPPALASPTDAIVWEAHIRDLTSHPSWQGPEEQRCTYLGAAYPGTAYKGMPTGFDYIRALGITHIQMLPIFDFVSVDEGRVKDPEYQSRPQHGAFNWGYDPGNYAAPEGSYATNPADGLSRFLELRRLVQALGQADIGVIMDVVYNHVPDRRRSALEACVPGYYFRGRRDSGAGDDTASERYMFRKYMIDTLSWWLSAFKLSGFRFDLMGLHDVETMQAISKALRGIKPDILLYGEGWNMYGGNQDKKSGKTRLEMASQHTIHKLQDFGMFNDAFRDGVKGSVFDAAGPGWIHDGRTVESVKFGLVGAVHHHQVHNHQVTGTAHPAPWDERSWASINYLEVHDNFTLFDKLQLVEPGRDRAYYAQLQRLAMTLLLTSQGIPVLHAGMEFLRTKEVPEAWIRLGGIDKCVTDPVTKRQFCHDSYKAGDLLNGLNWERAGEETATVHYVQHLLHLRTTLRVLRLATGTEIRKALKFIKDSEGIIAWQLDEHEAERGHYHLLIAASSRSEAVSLAIPAAPGPDSDWRLVANSATAETWEPDQGPLVNHRLEIPAKGALILYQQKP